MRQFETGATRDADDSKLDYEGFFSPLVLERRAEYMHKNRIQKDGQLRQSDNWQKGIPFAAYMKSLWRHFFAVWRGHRSGDDIEEELCAVMFNAEGYLHELLKAKRAKRFVAQLGPELIELRKDGNTRGFARVDGVGCTRNQDYPCGQPCACFKVPAYTSKSDPWKGTLGFMEPSRRVLPEIG